MSEEVKKRVFEVNGVKYAVVMPTSEQRMTGDEIKRKTFNKELNAGSLLRDQLDTELRKRKLWNDESQMIYDTLRKEVLDNEYALKKGGISLSKAKQIAIETKKKRNEMVAMLSSRTELDSNTCEGKSDSARFNYLFSVSLVYNDNGKPVFPNGLEDYEADLAHPAVEQGAVEFYYLYADAENNDGDLAENQFLKKYKFANDDYQLVDNEGKLVDEDGHHIDKDGKYIKWTSDKDYIFVDSLGRTVDEKGNYVVENPDPFLDDSGNPIDESLYSEEKVETTEETEQETAEPEQELKSEEA